MTVLEANHITKRYGRHSVLEDASFRVEPGEVVGLTGENGSGKSTALRIVMGLIEPDEGDVTITDRTGYCPQEPVLFDSLSLDDNLRYFAAGYGLSSAALRERAWELLAWLRCTEHVARPAGNLSGGTRQKLNLIIALLHDPTLLILDEPYQGFDYESYLAFWDLADGLRRDGRSLLVVSHLLLDRERFDRVYALRDGAAHVEQ
jgi:ABC-2 type transport system ATP-binding protein